MPNQADPAMAQWQMRFDTALRGAQDPRRPHETPQQAQQRVASMNQVLRQLQMSKPVGQPPPQGRMGVQQAPPQGGGGGIYDRLTQALRGAIK